MESNFLLFVYGHYIQKKNFLIICMAHIMFLLGSAALDNNRSICKKTWKHSLNKWST